MNRESDKGIAINVMGREFRVATPAGEERQLLASVDLLNRKMKEIRDTGRVVGNERIAIMAALNFAHEQLTSLSAKVNKPGIPPAMPTNSGVDEDYVRGRIIAFESIIEKAISEQEKLF